MSNQNFANTRRWSSVRESPSEIESIRPSLGIYLLYCAMLESSIFRSRTLRQIGSLTVGAILFGLTLLYTLWIMVAALVLVFQKTNPSKIITVPFVLLPPTVESLGFILALAFTALFYVIIGQLRSATEAAIRFVVLIPAALAVPLLLPMFAKSGADQTSDGVRVPAIPQVSDRTTIVSTVFGHGFGIGVPEWQEHKEIAYFEILYKRALVGLWSWAALFTTVLAIRFAGSVSRGDGEFTYPLLLTAVFIVREFAMNPFINTPTGIYPVLISLAGVGDLSSPAPEQSTRISYLPLRSGSS